MILSSALAGMILFPPVGLLLGLIGGRARESFIGAAIGAILGTALGMIASPAGFLNTATHALLIGALGGGHFSTLLDTCQVGLFSTPDGRRLYAETGR